MLVTFAHRDESSFPLPSECFTAETAICVMQLLLKLVNKRSLVKWVEEEMGQRAKKREQEQRE